MLLLKALMNCVTGSLCINSIQDNIFKSISLSTWYQRHCCSNQFFFFFSSFVNSPFFFIMSTSVSTFVTNINDETQSPFGINIDIFTSLGNLIYINVSTQAPFGLTYENYISWHAQWYSLLIGYDIIGYTTRDSVYLASSFARYFWIQQHHLLQSALIVSLFPPLTLLVKHG